MIPILVLILSLVSFGFSAFALFRSRAVLHSVEQHRRRLVLELLADGAESGPLTLRMALGDVSSELRALERDGLVRIREGPGGSWYSITDEGRAELRRSS